MTIPLGDRSRQLNVTRRPGCCGRAAPARAANDRRLVEQRYDWDAIGRRFVALVEETISY